MRNRSTKILATLGPASSKESVMRKMIDAGTDVFRLNFSHGTADDHIKNVSAIRKIESEIKKPVGILLDLQGPKLRIGEFQEGKVELSIGDNFIFDLQDIPGDRKRIHLPHPEVFKSLQPGELLLVDDGKMRFKILEVNDDCVLTEALTDGYISNRKGFNLPGTILDLPILTDKDKKDLELGLELGVDWVALSFVQRASDVAKVKNLVGGSALLMSKIEKPSALNEIDEIIDLSDGVMVARGDLGVELAIEKVPSVQKTLIRKCKEAGKAVVIATQMLESMISSPIPTRAEASDIATAVYDGVDAVMLSAESAVGDFPVEAVSMMDKIIVSTEEDPLHRLQLAATRHEDKDATDAIGAAILKITEILKISATVSYTTTGRAARRISRLRPDSPILGVTPDLKVSRQLNIYWGVTPVLRPKAKDVEEIVSVAVDVAKSFDLFSANDPLLVCAGIPLGVPGATNMLRIVWDHRES